MSEQRPNPTPEELRLAADAARRAKDASSGTERTQQTSGTLSPGQIRLLLGDAAARQTLAGNIDEAKKVVKAAGSVADNTDDQLKVRKARSTIGDHEEALGTISRVAESTPEALRKAAAEGRTSASIRVGKASYTPTGELNGEVARAAADQLRQQGFNASVVRGKETVHYDVVGGGGPDVNGPGSHDQSVYQIEVDWSGKPPETRQ